jgi:hypothetical protein
MGATEWDKARKRWFFLRHSIHRAIEAYFLGHEEHITLDWVVGYVRQKMQNEVTRGDLQELLAGFDQYEESEKFHALVERFKVEGLI